METLSSEILHRLPEYSVDFGIIYITWIWIYVTLFKVKYNVIIIDKFYDVSDLTYSLKFANR